MTGPSDRHASLQTSVCTPWATEADVYGDDDVQFEEGLLDQSLLIASDILFLLTGRKWAGECADTVRPVLRSVAMDFGRPVRPPWPFSAPYLPWAGWGTYSYYLINSTDRSGGQVFPEITLGAYPVTGVTQVTIDGQVVDPSTYRVDDNRWLVRLADPVTGDNPGWPATNARDLDITHKGTWEVQFTYGVPPPPGGVRSAATLGYQLALANTPRSSGKCRLPQRVTSITRQGVSMVLLDPMVFLKEGRTGLYDVDMWINSVNGGVPFARRGRVSSPDVRRRVTRTAP